jgi:hypothetical protein
MKIYDNSVINKILYMTSIQYSIICNFCQKNFKTKATLDFHQKTNKSCLEKQGKKTNKEYKCDYCDKILSTNLRLNTHMEICKAKLKNIGDEKDEKIYKILKENEDYKIKIDKLLQEKDDNIEKVVLEYKIKLLEKEEYILKLEQMLEKANLTISEIAKQPKNITTNTNTNSNNRIRNQNNIQNNFDINDVEKITHVLENHLTPEVLCKGQKGVAEMLKQHLLQTEDGIPLYECTDISRQKFEFINKDGIIEVDSKATKLITSLNKANIYDKAHNTGQKLWEKEDGTVDYQAQHVHMPKVVEVLEINQDSSKLRSHLASITSK